MYPPNSKHRIFQAPHIAHFTYAAQAQQSDGYSHLRWQRYWLCGQMSDGKEPDGEKRKHAGGDGVISGSQKKAREVNGEETATAVTDDEVEEFYAILRRINTAVKYFRSGNDHVVGMKAEGSRSQRRWRAWLEEEIMQEVNAVKGQSRREEDVEENLSLDLNVTPQTE